MATINWKILSLLTALLLAALGLQAGAIKIMLNMAHTPQVSMPVVPPSTPMRRSVAPVEEQATADPVPAVRETKATVVVADPPHLADLSAKPSVSASANDLNPEARSIAPVPTAVAPSAEAALVATPKPAPTHPQDSHASASAATPTRTTSTPSAPTEPAKLSAAPSPEAGLSAPAPVPAEATGSDTLQQPEWLKKRDPKHYTVQLYSGKDMGTLKEIAATVGTGEPQAYYSTGNRSGVWHSLVAGDYPDAATAQAAAAKFTAQSPALKPWIRRFEEIQAKLR
ncbi:MAG: SPOR domain-containing protein [Candidatus Competibacter denitrificans]